MMCPQCGSNSVSTVPAEIRLYRNAPRTLSYPPLTPYPDIHVCADCGWSQFVIPHSWLSAGWLRPPRPQPVPNANRIALSNVTAIAR
jgi:hypothetical protein